MMLILVGSLICCNSFAIPHHKLPDLGHSARNVITVAQERKLGQAFLRNLQPQILADPLVTDYIQQLGQRLAPLHPTQNYTFFVVDQPSLNAFAGPDGHIGIHAGLILTTQTESELASVVAHEIAHVTQQHLLQAWQNAETLSLPQAALTLAAIALGAASGNQAGLALAAGSQAALRQQRINYTRRHELEADRLGIQLLAQAGYDPRAMATFFTRVAQANRVYTNHLPPLLRSHPLNTQRTAEALDRAADYPYTQHQPDDLAYQLAYVRLQHQQRRPAIHILQQQLATGHYRHPLAAEYALVLVLQAAQRWAEAVPHLHNLLHQQPKVPAFIIAQARQEVQQQQIPQALQRLQTALGQNPTGLALAITHAEIALAHSMAQTALDQLQQQIRLHPQQPKLYQLLARAAGQLKQPVLAHQYLAEHYALQGRYTQAMQQLQEALRQPNLPSHTQAKLRTRLATLQALYTETHD